EDADRSDQHRTDAECEDTGAVHSNGVDLAQSEQASERLGAARPPDQGIERLLPVLRAPPLRPAARRPVVASSEALAERVTKPKPAGEAWLRLGEPRSPRVVPRGHRSSASVFGMATAWCTCSCRC